MKQKAFFIIFERLLLKQTNKISFGGCEPAFNVGGNRLSSSRYQELLGVLIDHKLTFENHHLNNVQKVNQKLDALARISK